MTCADPVDSETRKPRPHLRPVFRAAVSAHDARFVRKCRLVAGNAARGVGDVARVLRVLAALRAVSVECGLERAGGGLHPSL